MPVDQFRRVGVVVNIDHDALAFLEPQQRSGKLAVVERRRDDVVRCQLDQPGCDAQRIVRLLGGDFVGRRVRRGFAFDLFVRPSKNLQLPSDQDLVGEKEGALNVTVHA